MGTGGAKESEAGRGSTGGAGGNETAWHRQAGVPANRHEQTHRGHRQARTVRCADAGRLTMGWWPSKLLLLLLQRCSAPRTAGSRPSPDQRCTAWMSACEL